MRVLPPHFRAASGTLTALADAGGLRGMKDWGEFERIVVTVVMRFFRQNAQVLPPEVELSEFAARLAAVVAERGLPRPLAPGEVGAPGGMSDEESAPLIAQVKGSGASPLLADAAKQLVKACFYPEFTVCRDSYREAARDDSCKRQDLSRVRGRISGTHCVDCPYWVALEPQAHFEAVAPDWRAGPVALAQEREIFLPEDFRALRVWLWRAARD